jgi:NADPH-dependent dioxygenase
MLFPFPDPHKWRLLDTTGEGDPARPREIADRLRSKLSAALGRDTPVAAPTWASNSTLQQRAVPAMHVCRCFVSGDAAHVHSPPSGQGMNTGIHDAYNLAWKLAMVVRGGADAALLETYDRERVPVGQALLASTGEAMASAMTDAVEDDTAQSDYAFMRRLIRGMSGLMIAYPDSPLTIGAGVLGSDGHDGGARVSPGERLTQIGAADAEAAGWIHLRRALRTSGWHLLASAEPPVGRPGPADSLDLPSWLRRVVLDDGTDPEGVARLTLGLSGRGWILVRPDGYVAARGAPDGLVRQALLRLETSVGTRLRALPR